MSLTSYRQKRTFRKTPEPAGRIVHKTTGSLRFVVQKHAASHLHYDFRLEWEGVLKSWAVPKGPSLDPQRKSLAVQVEDHPLEYAKFEGVIPEGQYGGGTVMVWDQGTWLPEGNPAAALKRGKLNFELDGEKLHGKWTLVQMDGRAGKGGKNWLLMKRDDAAARSQTEFDVLEEQSTSALSGRTMEEIASGEKTTRRSRSNNRSPQKTRSRSKDVPAKAKPGRRATTIESSRVSSLPGARRTTQPEVLEPQLATLVSTAPTGDEWLHEAKFDGYRIVATIAAGKVRLFTRTGKDWTRRFSPIAKAVEALPFESAILDGEVVVLDEEGRTHFQRLQNVMERGDVESVVYYLFDLPYAEGFSLVDTTLIERKEYLAQVLATSSPDNDGTIRYSQHVRGNGPRVLDEARKGGLEGIVSKRVDSSYRPGRNATWVKTKCLLGQEFVIGGYTKPTGARQGFGALLVGYYDHDRFVYCGCVGTGFTAQSLREIKHRLDEQRIDRPAFENPPQGPRARHATWVRPTLVAEVKFLEWTADGMLRQPAFEGLREDKPAKDIVREQPASPKAIAVTNKQQSASVSMRKTRRKAVEEMPHQPATIAGVTLSHPERILFPEKELTKLGLAQFYESIADWILPHLVGRPLTLVRCPRGRQHPCFYQKHLSETLPEHLRTVTIREKTGTDQYVVLDDLSGLVALVQRGVLEIHPWGAKADDPERPDRLVFDLDPGEDTPWTAVMEGARDIRQCLVDRGLTSFVRTSGGKGLHVVVPLTRRQTWDEVRTFSESIARMLEHEKPTAYVATMTKARRGGKVFVDYLRNQRGATAVASYSTRAREGAPVATPLRWEELSTRTMGDAYTVANLPARLVALSGDPWEGFFSCRQSLSSKTIASAQRTLESVRTS